MSTNTPAQQLTLKQQRFVNAYIANGGNASDAYRQAYDAENMADGSIRVAACRLLDNANVALALQQTEAEATRAAQLQPAFIVSRWMRNMDAALEQERPQIAASNQAGELLARHLRLAGFDRSDTGTQVNVQINNPVRERIASMSDDEIRRLALGDGDPLTIEPTADTSDASEQTA